MNQWDEDDDVLAFRSRAAAGVGRQTSAEHLSTWVLRQSDWYDLRDPHDLTSDKVADVEPDGQACLRDSDAITSSAE